jgi:chromosomal replication initiation ATPase DnaA
MTQQNNPDDALPTGQLTLELSLEPAQGEEDFMVGEGNELAHSRIMAFPHWPDPITLLSGPAKSGKSHLVRIFADRARARFAGVDELEALAAAGGTQPLIVEDVDRLGYDEAGLFHLLNQSMREQRPLLLTAREDVTNWPLATDDVRSRVRRASAFALELTDDIQLSQMFVKLFGDRQVRVDPKVISYLVARMERSTEEAVILADVMDRLALARGMAMTRKLAAEALELRRVARGEASADTDWEGDEDDDGTE